MTTRRLLKPVAAGLATGVIQCWTLYSFFGVERTPHGMLVPISFLAIIVGWPLVVFYATADLPRRFRWPGIMRGLVPVLGGMAALSAVAGFYAWTRVSIFGALVAMFVSYILVPLSKLGSEPRIDLERSSSLQGQSESNLRAAQKSGTTNIFQWGAIFVIVFAGGIVQYWLVSSPLTSELGLGGSMILALSLLIVVVGMLLILGAAIHLRIEGRRRRRALTGGVAGMVCGMVGLFMQLGFDAWMPIAMVLPPIGLTVLILWRARHVSAALRREDSGEPLR